MAKQGTGWRQVLGDRAPADWVPVDWALVVRVPADWARVVRVPVDWALVGRVPADWVSAARHLVVRLQAGRL